MTISLTTFVGDKQVPVPLKKVHNHVDVINTVCQHIVTQVYVNEEDIPIEVIYTFPTPAGASVHDFKATIGDRTIHSSLKEKEEAKKEYTDAKNKGEGAYYMERIDDDCFSCCLGNVPPHTEIVLVIKYSLELKTQVDCTQIRVNIPLSMMPRYVPKDEKNQQKGRAVNPPKTYDKPYDVMITGHVEMLSGITSFSSPSHADKIKISNNSDRDLSLMIENLADINKDIIFEIVRKTPVSSCVSQMLIQDNELNPGFKTQEKYKHASMLNIVPNFAKITTPKPTEVHYNFVLDNSGSMEGKDMKNCKETAKIAVSSLPNGCSFDIYKFNSDFERMTLPENVQMGTMQHKGEALKWINDIDATGGTEVLPVLCDIYDRIKQMEKPSVIIFVSDGGVSNTEKVLELVNTNKHVSVFSIGIGDNVSTALIDGMAKNSVNGKSEYVNSNSSDDTQIREITMGQLKKAQQSIAKINKGYTLEVETVGSYEIIRQNNILFENDDNCMFILSEKPITNVKYSQDDNESVNVPVLSVNYEGYPLHRIIGMKLLEKEIDKTHVINTSLNMGVLSKYTSFIGIEERTAEQKEAADVNMAEIREVSLQIPDKYKCKRIADCVEESCMYVGTRSAAAFSVMSKGSPGPTGAQGSRGVTGGSGQKKQMGGQSYYASRSYTACCSSRQDERCYDDTDSDKPDTTNLTVKFVITANEVIPACTKLDKLLIGNENGEFIFIQPNNLQVNDHIAISFGDNQGIYKIVSIGDNYTPWVLQYIAEYKETSPVPVQNTTNAIKN